mgnify:CR=1 FL=1
MSVSPLDDRHDDVTPRSALSHEERAARTSSLLQRAADLEAAGDDTGREACLAEVVELNMRIAEAVARRYARKGIATEDLTQVAYVALIRAVRSYDVRQGHDLLSYAVPSMTGEIRRHFRDHGWTIRPPRDVQRAHSRLVRSGATLDRLDEQGLSALAAEVEESVEVVREALAARSCFSLVSLDTPAPGQEDGPVREVSAGEDRDAEQAEARLLVQPLLARLSPKEKQVLRLRFAEELSQREIALRLGMSQVQVSRLLQRMLTQMRGTLERAS